DHVEVERDLLRPTAVGARIIRAALLVDLAEATVGSGARRQSKLRAVNREIAFGIGIVKGVHDGDRLAGAVAERRSRQAVRLLQIARIVAAGPGRLVRVALLIDLDQSVPARVAAGSGPADLGRGGAQRLLNGSGLVICRRVIDVDCAGGEKDGESKRKN